MKVSTTSPCSTPGQAKGRSTRPAHVLAAIALALGAGAGAQAATPADIEAQYRNDVARCNSGQTAQSQADCMREAGAARQEAMRNRLQNNGNYDNNRYQRCQSLPAAQRDDCMKQMHGDNTRVMGSVEGGGVLRETTIPIPAPASSTPAAPPAAPSSAETIPVPGTSAPR